MQNIITRNDLMALEENESEENSRIFQKLVEKLFALWPWLIISVLLGLGLSYLYLFMSTPTYKIHASVLVQDDKKGTDFAESQILQDFGLLSGKSNVDNEAEIFKSRTIMEQVVSDLELNVHYVIPGRLKPTEIYNERPVTFGCIGATATAISQPVVYRFAFEKSDITAFTLVQDEQVYRGHIGDTLQLKEGPVQVTVAPGYSKWPMEQPLDIMINPLNATAQFYMNALSVDIPNKQVSVIYLTLSETIRSKGESILNALTRVYLQANVNDKNRIADSTMGFIDKRLSIVSRELSGIEKDIEGFKTTNKLTDLSEQSKLLLENTSEFSRQLTTNEVQLAVVDTLETFLKTNINKTRIVPSTLIMQDPNFISVVQRYNEMQLQHDRMLMSQTASHPTVISMNEQLQNLRIEMLSSLASIKKGITVSIAELKKRTSGFENQISKVPAKERVFLDFSRQQAIKQELYLFLLKKREETAISKSSTLANARIIDSAKADGNPFKPQKSMITMMGFLVGLIIPFAISFLKDFLNNRISSLEDINNLTKAPVLAEIGHNNETNVVAVTLKSRQLIAEQFRALRTNLQYLLPGENDNTILVTSSMSGEGKSFLCINVAITLALAGKKVILLEMDLRKPKISNNLGLEKRGFTNYIISQDTNWQSWIQASGVQDNLDVLSSGPVPPNPTELLLLPKTKALFNDLKKQYDFVIIDSPPVGLVTDAEIMALYANATLYLVRHQLTHKQQVRLIDKFHQKKSLPKLNIVVNDAQTKKTSYGYGYRYSYGYGYGYGYGNYESADTNSKRKMTKKQKA